MLPTSLNVRGARDSETDMESSDTLTIEDLRRGVELLNKARTLICGDTVVSVDCPTETCILPVAHEGIHKRARI